MNRISESLLQRQSDSAFQTSVAKDEMIKKQIEAYRGLADSATTRGLEQGRYRMLKDPRTWQNVITGTGKINVKNRTLIDKKALSNKLMQIGGVGNQTGAATAGNLKDKENGKGIDMSK